MAPGQGLFGCLPCRHEEPRSVVVVSPHGAVPLTGGRATAAFPYHSVSETRSGGRGRVQGWGRGAGVEGLGEGGRAPGRWLSGSLYRCMVLSLT